MSRLLRAGFDSRPLVNFRREMDRWFGDFFGQSPATGARVWQSTAYPSLNIWEEGDVFYAEAEVPGLKSEELEISVVGDQLTIKGRRETNVESNGKFHRRERSVGEFVRTLTLPAEIDGDKVEALLADGVLKLTLPKAEAAKPRKIAVQRN